MRIIQSDSNSYGLATFADIRTHGAPFLNAPARNFLAGLTGPARPSPSELNSIGIGYGFMPLLRDQMRDILYGPMDTPEPRSLNNTPVPGEFPYTRNIPFNYQK